MNSTDSNGTTATTSNKSRESEKANESSSRDTITYNEAFFADQANALNPKFNPLLYKNKQTKLDKITAYASDIEQKLGLQDDENNENNELTQSNSNNEDPKTATSTTTTFTLPPLTNSNTAASTSASSISRDGFVTNHRWILLIIEKKSCL